MMAERITDYPLEVRNHVHRIEQLDSNDRQCAIAELLLLEAAHDERVLLEAADAMVETVSENRFWGRPEWQKWLRGYATRRKESN